MLCVLVMATESSLDALYWFVTVATNDCSFTDAAEALGVSQPAVSRRILALEERLGQELFIRGRDGNSLTPAGRMLLRHARQALANVEEAEAELARLRTGQPATETLRVGYSPSHVTMVASALAVIGDRPGLTVFTEEMDAAELEERLLGRGKRAGEPLDIGLAYVKRPRAGLRDETVRELPLALIVNREHPLAREGRPVSVAALLNERLALPTRKLHIRATINQYFGKQRPRNVVLEANAVATLLAAARVGFAATILPGLRPDGFVVRPLPRAPRQTTSLLWRADVELSDVARAFAKAVRDGATAPLSSA